MEKKDEELYNLIKKYKKKKNGRIAKIYTRDEELAIYEAAAKIIDLKFDDIISKEETFELLSKKGNIYSMDFCYDNRIGMCEKNSCNIGVNSIIKKMTPTLMHELIHKLGFVRGNKSFFKMNNIYLEAGTELVTSELLKTKDCYIEGTNGIWTKTSDAQEVYFLQIALVNQINYIIDDNMLEKSILKGENYFEQAIIDKFGSHNSKYISIQLEDIKKLQEEYNVDRNLGVLELLKSKISNLQDNIMDLAFKNRYKSIENETEAEEYLKDLIDFSFQRVKFTDMNNLAPSDNSFEDYFKLQKNELEERFNTKFDVEYRRIDWLTKYEFRVVDEIDDSEERDIAHLANKLEAKFVKRKIIDRVKKFFGRFGLEDGNNLKLSERNTDNEETSIGEQENVIKEESFEDKLKLEYDINVSTSYNENNSLVDGKKERIGRD